MDYSGEQQMELEALEAIYGDELQVYNGTLPSEWPAVGNTYKMTIVPQDEDGEEAPDEELEMELLWAHTANYPEEGPCIKLQAVYGLTDGEVARCQGVLEQQAEENKGMAMIYTLITAAKEWLRNLSAERAEPDPEELAKKAAAEEEARRQEARAHGTPVTIEAFMSWKAHFDAEQAAAKARAMDAAKEEERAKRVTGKAWFMSDRAEASTEAGALSDEDEEDFGEEEEEYRAGADAIDEEDEIDYEDDDDEGFLDELGE